MLRVTKLSLFLKLTIKYTCKPFIGYHCITFTLQSTDLIFCCYCCCSFFFTNHQVTLAEVKIATALVDNNIPFSAADTFSPSFNDIFPDFEIAKSYASARTKTTCIVNCAL